MSKIQVLNAANDLGILKLFFKEGLMSPTLQSHYEIYLQVEAQMKTNGGKKTKAVKDVADKMNLADGTIWYALSELGILTDRLE